MKQRIAIVTVITLALAAMGATLAAGDDGSRQAKTLQARVLSGFEEVPAVSTSATGQFRVKINQDDTAFEYTLTYSGLQGQVVQAHIHFAQPGVNGGIVAWLCGTENAPGPAGTPTCPQEGTVTGTITADDILATPPAQQIPAGGFDQVLEAMRAGVTYANVHTVISPGGEIRGQIR